VIWAGWKHILIETASGNGTEQSAAVIVLIKKNTESLD